MRFNVLLSGLTFRKHLSHMKATKLEFKSKPVIIIVFVFCFCFCFFVFGSVLMFVIQVSYLHYLSKKTLRSQLFNTTHHCDQRIHPQRLSMNHLIRNEGKYEPRVNNTVFMFQCNPATYHFRPPTFSKPHRVIS